MKAICIAKTFTAMSFAAMSLAVVSTPAFEPVKELGLSEGARHDSLRRSEVIRWRAKQGSFGLTGRKRGGTLSIWTL
jgi:hypothetical protein